MARSILETMEDGGRGARPTRQGPGAFVLAAAAALAAGVSLPAGAAAAGKNEAPRNVSSLASQLAGVFRGSSPGNDLTIVSTALRSSPGLQIEMLEVLVTGRYKGDAVLLRGLWRVSREGEAYGLAFIPGVNTIQAQGRVSDPTFVPIDLEAGCWTQVTPRADAFEGTIRTFPNCRQAIGAGEVQSVGKEWTARFSRNEIRFENRETGELLTFSRGSPGR
jgi:hypothetical protein